MNTPSKTTTRRVFLQMAPVVAGTAAIGAPLPELLTAQERLDLHFEGLRVAWSEIYGEPFVAEINVEQRFLLVASEPVAGGANV